MAIISAFKITKPLGEINRFKLMNRTVNLPTSGKKFHVYQVGQVHPSIVGLLPRNPEWAVESWVNFSDCINNSKLFASIYNKLQEDIDPYGVMGLENENV